MAETDTSGTNPWFDMKKSSPILLLLCLLCVPMSQAQSVPPLKLIQTIDLPNLEGYLDHMSADIKGQRLFVPGEYQQTLEIVDLRTGKVIRSISSFGGHPRTAIYIPASNEIWVDDADGSCKVFSGDSYELVRTIELTGLGKDSKKTPDNAIYDPSSGLMYVAVTAGSAGPEANGSIEIVDTRTSKYLGGIALHGKVPAGIALDRDTARMFVVLADTGQVEVLDRVKRSVIAEWPVVGGPVPHAAAIDAANHRLFIGSRIQPGHLYKPGKLIVMDTETGKIVQSLDSEGGPDELEYDAPSRRIYFTGTTGAVEVFEQVDSDHYKSLGRVATGAIAKTSLLVPELKQFYVGVPKHVILTPPIPQAKEETVEDAKILVFEVTP